MACGNAIKEMLSNPRAPFGRRIKGGRQCYGYSYCKCGRFEAPTGYWINKRSLACDVQMS